MMPSMPECGGSGHGAGVVCLSCNIASKQRLSSARPGKGSELYPLSRGDAPGHDMTFYDHGSTLADQLGFTALLSIVGKHTLRVGSEITGSEPPSSPPAGSRRGCTLPISLDTVSDSLLTKLATKPMRQSAGLPVASAHAPQTAPASPEPHTLPCTHI